MARKINTAITSFGMSGLVFHGPLLKASPGFEVVKILERSKNNSVKMFPSATIARSYEEILSDESVELVIVNTPDEFHFEMAKAALEAGKHVVVEKPFTRLPREAEELISLAGKKGVILTVFQNRRWDGDFLTVKKVVGEKLVGRLVEFESHYDRYRNHIAGSWKEEPGEYGGVLYNLGSHMVDQALVLFGKPKAVTAHFDILRTGGKVSDYYDIRLQYDGFAALLKCSYLVLEQGPRYIIHGTNGSFLKWGIDPQEEALKSGILPEGENWGKEAEPDWGYLTADNNGLVQKSRIETIPGDYRLFYQNLAGAIRHGEPLAVKPEEALLVIEILETCLESNRLGKTVFLENKKAGV
jgi:scyllo-inositol 2-dehydrogenase (NADP+)